MITPWTAQAFNQVPNSPNEIHGDALAREYGFDGALVPGVTVSAYLIHPAVQAWGLDWLANGAAHVRVSSPLYDGEQFEVRIEAYTETSYFAELVRPNGRVSATGEVSLPTHPHAPALRRGDPVMAADYAVPAASFETFDRLQREGCMALRFRWGGAQEMSSYLRDEAGMPPLLQSGDGGYANMSFILGCSNWALDRNATMNPWVHLETRSQNYRPIAAGTAVIAEMTISDFYEKKGHEFVDVEVALFDEADDACLNTIQLRAIFKLRGA